MGFEFQDKFVVEADGQWDLKTIASAWAGLEGLMDKLNEQYRSHTRFEGSPSELNYNAGRTNLNRSGQVLITNARDSIHIKRERQQEDYRGRIEIKVIVSNDQLRVAIEDNGAGVHPGIEPYLFTRLDTVPIPPHLLKENMDPKADIAGKSGDDLDQVRINVGGLGGFVFYRNKGDDIGAIFGYEVPISSLRVPSPIQKMDLGQ